MTSTSNVDARLARIEERLDRLEAVAVSDDAIVQASQETKPVSIKEYLIDKNPQTANDRTLTMGYFLESISGQEQFTAEDIKGCFRMAKIPAPTNVNDIINKNIAKGFMMESGKSGGVKSWVLTATGEAVAIKGFRTDK
jgi:hypothetical protein